MPLASNYRPELESSPELSKSDEIQVYQELIGVLRWAVELGSVDILLETLLMLTYMAMPAKQRSIATVVSNVRVP